MPKWLLVICLAALVAGASGQYRLRNSNVNASVEYSFADSKLLTRDAVWLLEGASGRKRLIDEARSRDAKRAQAARLTMFHSGDLSFLPILLERLGPRYELESPIAQTAAQTWPKEAWPLLIRLAEQGDVDAMPMIDLYVDLRGEALLRLSRNRFASIRASAILFLNDSKVSYEALADPVEKVRLAAALTLIGDDRLLRDPRWMVRAAAAEVWPKWTSPKDWWAWVRLAKDPRPEVRRWAVLQMSPLGLEWGNGPWTSEGIDAVYKAIKLGPNEVRERAVLAARGWLLEWPRIHTRWTEAQITKARETFRLPGFREAAYRQARTEKSFGSDYLSLGIQAAPAHRALALSGDPRALPVFQHALRERPWERADWIQSLAYLPDPKTDAYLFRLIEREAKRLRGNQEFEARQLFGHSVNVLRERKTRDFGMAVKILGSAKVDPMLRTILGLCLAPVGTAEILAGLTRLATDLSLTVPVRSSAVFALSQCTAPGTDEVLERIAKEDPSPDVRGSATSSLLGRRSRG